MFYVHLTGTHTGTTVVALGSIYLDTHNAESVKQAINSAERADKTAEAAVYKHTCQNDQHQNDKFTCKEFAQHGKKSRVFRI